MKLKELQPNQGKVDVTVEVISKEPIRSFNKFGKDGRVCNAIVKDDSGQVKLTLWNEEVDKINVGDILQITNGYVKEWQGELQLSAGKFGKMEVTGKSDNASANPSQPAENKASPKEKTKSTDDFEDTGDSESEESFDSGDEEYI